MLFRRKAKENKTRMENHEISSAWKGKCLCFSLRSLSAFHLLRLISQKSQNNSVTFIYFCLRLKDAFLFLSSCLNKETLLFSPFYLSFDWLHFPQSNECQNYSNWFFPGGCFCLLSLSKMFSFNNQLSANSPAGGHVYVRDILTKW